MCRAQSADPSKLSLDYLAMHPMKMFFVASIDCVLTIMAFCILNIGAKPDDYRPIRKVARPFRDNNIRQLHSISHDKGQI